MSVAAGGLIPPGARSFGKYELLTRLATGGMAEIFLARRRDGDKSWIVIKRVLPHLAEDRRFVAMFRDEARLAARIEHANVCRVLELGAVGEIYFIAMEYLHGVPLSRVLLRAARAHAPVDVRLVASIIHQCCAGLQDAHELKSQDGRLLDVVHRDVSPPNIFLTTDGMAKVLDFGVAKARGASQKTRTGTIKGKNAYMSPEQVLGEAVDRRSDIFALGTVMWESLTASRLFLRDLEFETFRAITKGEVPNVLDLRPDCPPALAAVVHRALARERDERFATAAELGAAIEAAVVETGGVATTDDLARYVQGQFSKELMAKQQLLDLAAAPAGSGSATVPSSALAAFAPSPSETLEPGAEAAGDEDSDAVAVPPVPSEGAGHRPSASNESSGGGPGAGADEFEVTRLRLPRSRSTSGEIFPTHRDDASQVASSPPATALPSGVSSPAAGNGTRAPRAMPKWQVVGLILLGATLVAAILASLL